MIKLLLLSLLVASVASAQIKVATLHPLMADLARQVGGDRVQVIEVLKAGDDIHHFEPSSKDIAAMRGVKLILASGKHLESYLTNLRDSVGGVTVFEVGRSIPSIKIAPGSELFMCCPAHAAGGIDPHWWHDPDNMARAARDISSELAKVDPEGKAIYKANASATEQRMTALEAWAKQQFTAIPREQRKLVTAHAAYGYFCKAFGFKSLPLLGIARQDEASAEYITTAIKTIQESGIRAVFPEDQSNPKLLREVVKQTGVKLGDALVPDGTAAHAHTYETMMRHNVSAIVKAMLPK